MAAQNVALKCTLLAHSSDERLLCLFFCSFLEEKKDNPTISTEKHDTMTQKKNPREQAEKENGGVKQNKYVCRYIYGGEGAETGLKNIAERTLFC